MSKRIAIFASGSGSNAQSVIQYFEKKESAKVVLVGCNNTSALVLKRAGRLGVNSFVFNKASLTRSSVVLETLLIEKIDFIVLAGFLLKIPKKIIQAFPKRIINLHPSLLPKFGGKGMYGKHVHKAVFDSGEKETGITIHYVNGFYDMGAVIFQAKCDVVSSDSVESIASKVAGLERQYFAKTIDLLIDKL